MIYKKENGVINAYETIKTEEMTVDEFQGKINKLKAAKAALRDSATITTRESDLTRQIAEMEAILT